MQRFFSTFPGEWPGAGLLLLRLTLGGGLIANAAANLRGSPLSHTLPAIAEILAGMLVVIGLWTPIAAASLCVLELLIAMIADRPIELQLLRSAIALSVALLGPGAWSIDAHLFGRRRVEIKNLREE